MTSPRAPKTARQFIGICLVAAFCAAASLSSSAALAQNTQDGPKAVEAVPQELQKLMKELNALTKSIDDAAKVIGGMTDPKGAAKKTEELRGLVGKLLDQAADNGTISQLASTASSYIDKQMQGLAQDTRFTTDERQMLLSRWEAKKRQMQAAVSDIQSARKELVGLLGMLQSREDLLGELAKLAEAETMIKIVRDLATKLRDSSALLNAVLGSMKGAGS